MAEYRAWLLVLSDRQALGWVLRTERMAFAPHRASLAAQLSVGDLLFLYTTRGCFYNPTRDRGRVIGEARAASPVSRLSESVEIAGRVFTHGCQLNIETLVARGAGPELAAMRDRLPAFAENDGWAVRLRTPLVPLGEADAAVLHESLARDYAHPRDVLQGYLDAALPPNPAYQTRHAAA